MERKTSDGGEPVAGNNSAEKDGKVKATVTGAVTTPMESIQASKGTKIKDQKGSSLPGSTILTSQQSNIAMNATKAVSGEHDDRGDMKETLNLAEGSKSTSNSVEKSAIERQQIEINKTKARTPSSSTSRIPQQTSTEPALPNGTAISPLHTNSTSLDKNAKNALATADTKPNGSTKETIGIPLSSSGSKPSGTQINQYQTPQPKLHTQHHQSQTQQPHRYVVPNRQNNEEAVFKIVQNIFKLLETRGPLTLAQLEYNLPILTLGSSSTSSPTPKAGNVSPSIPTDAPTSKNARDDLKPSEDTNGDDNTRNIKRTSLIGEKLIPENVVPDIVELLVTLGLIQQEAPAKGSHSSNVQSHPRFAIHFGKSRQFLVTPTNILSEIAKAQSETKASRQRQEMLKEALKLSDRQAAERVKHIVLQHPQVVDDPVYVTALRNLQVDGMLMAGSTGASISGSNSNSSSLSHKATTKTQKVDGGVKRSQPDCNAAKRKRQRSKKEGSQEPGTTSFGLAAPPATKTSKLETTGTRVGKIVSRETVAAKGSS